MLYNATSIFSQAFANLSNYAFGTNVITCLLVFLLFFIIGLLIKIPLALNLALYIPLSIICMAMGLLPVVAGVSMVVILMVLTGISLVSNF